MSMIDFEGRGSCRLLLCAKPVKPSPSSQAQPAKPAKLSPRLNRPMSEKSHVHAATVVRQLADWIGAFAASPLPPPTAERARALLLDALACALYASTDDKAASALRTVTQLSGSGTC